MLFSCAKRSFIRAGLRRAPSVYQFIRKITTSRMERINRDHKVLIVGGGPAGLTAAIYTGRANLKPIVASGEVLGPVVPGGQLMITSEVENFPGFPEGIQGPELIDKFSQQAIRFGAKIVEKWATNFSLKPGGPHQAQIGDELYEIDAVIFANGAAARWLNAPGEDNYINRGISACATCDGPLPVYRNKHLFVVGGGDTALEEALFLTRFASKVTIIHRRDKLRASKVMQDRATMNPKIDFLWNTVITGYSGTGKLEGIKCKNMITGEENTIPATGLFMAIGHEPLTRHVQGAGLDMNASGYINVKDNIYTNIEGVFAAGDVHDQHFRQAITAAGFGCMAAIACERWLEARNSKL